jgi:putative transposase
MESPSQYSRTVRRHQSGPRTPGGFATANPYKSGTLPGMQTDRPNRQSMRLKGFNYAGPGTYFVTICTDDRSYLFGQVVDKQMHLSRFGEIASREWRISLKRRAFIVPHAFVVMPNHVHGLVSIDPEAVPVFDRDAISKGLRPRSLGAFLNRYKGAVSTPIREMLSQPKYVVWQRNYHDRIVRDEREYESVLSYIENNPARWEEDRFNNDI